ncbi:unnamed protein product, partial [Cladocopium goreaui]
MADAETSMSLLKEIGRVKIELNSCSEGSKAEVQAKLDLLLAEHASKAEMSADASEPAKGPERRAKSKSDGDLAGEPKAPKAVKGLGPERLARAPVPKIPKIPIPTSHPSPKGLDHGEERGRRPQIPTATPG